MLTTKPAKLIVALLLLSLAGGAYFALTRPLPPTPGEPLAPGRHWVGPLATAAGRETAREQLRAARETRPVLTPAPPGDYDLVVYGATPSGIVAAIQAARLGNSVALLAESTHLGGVVTAGLGATDLNNLAAVGGIAREFYQWMYLYYSLPEAWVRETQDEYWLSLGTDFWYGRSDTQKMHWMFEPGAARTVFDAMLAAAGVPVALDARLERTAGVSREAERITALRTESGAEYRAQVFIDASYEGDLLAAAGVSYTVGREGNARYGEQYNGIRFNASLGINPYVVPGDPISGLLPYIEPDPPGTDGAGDHRVQAYGYRFPLTQDRENQVPLTRPEGYDPLLYEVLARRFAIEPGLTLGQVLALTPIPNRKTDTNLADLVGGNYAWPEGSYAERERIAAAHESYVRGLLWFLASDPRVPETVRRETQTWGFAADEFTANANFPPQLYVREARRLVSGRVLTEHNLKQTEAIPDSVGLGSYWQDSHLVSRFVDLDGKVRNEGHLWAEAWLYPIPYATLTPAADEAANLLVTVAVAASHAAYGSLRMEPVYMVLGQSAATAAVLAIERNCPVQAIPMSEFQTRLRQDGQVLDPADARAPRGVDIDLTPYLECLAGRQAIADPTYWIANAPAGRQYRVAAVTDLLLGLGQQFDPAAGDLASAAAALQRAGVIGSPGYWVETLSRGAAPPKEYVVNVIIAGAQKLRAKAE